MKWWDRTIVVCILVGIACAGLWGAGRTEQVAWLRPGEWVPIYFANADATGLEARPTWMPLGADRVAFALEELLRGPSRGSRWARTVPEGTQVREVWSVGSTLFVSFSEELQLRHWGGSTGEIMTIYSIVNTLTELEGIDEVAILIEGRAVESLAGHLDTSGPIARDANWLTATPD